MPVGMPTAVKLREKLCDKTPDGQVAAEIHQSASYRFRISLADINIEDFLEHLYELQLLLWLAQSSSLPTLLPDLTANSPILGSVAGTLTRVQQRVYQLLHETCGDASGKKVNMLWNPILEAVSSHQPVVPIFTLNYDWSFEKLAIEEMKRYQLVDGFELLGGTWDASRFANVVPASHKTNIVLFKLHGSTNWLPGGPVKSMGSFPPDLESDDGMPPHQFEMVYPGHAHEKWFGKEAWGPLSGPNGMFGSWDEREPYQTLYAQLHQIFRRAQLIVVIGYAFHDQRVNREIVEAVKANDGRMVLVVDPGIERYVKQSNSTHWDPPFEWMKLSEPNCPWSRFIWLQGCFGDKSATTAIVDAIRSAVST